MLFFIAGLLVFEYAIVVIICAAVGAFLGVAIVQNIVKKSGHPSYIVLILAGILVVALIMIVVYGILNLFGDDAKYEFSSFC